MTQAIHPTLTLMLPALLLAATVAANAQVEWVRRPAEEAPQYGQFELAFRLGAEAEGPWVTDPQQLGAEFVAPSGSGLALPAFRNQDFQFGAATPRETRASVGGLKIYVPRSEWGDARSLTLFLDDVRLTNEATGAVASLGDFEAGPGGWVSQAARAVAVTDETAASGRRSLRVDVTFSDQARWPGAMLHVGGADWRAYDRLVFAVRPEGPGGRGRVRAEYVTSEGRIIRAGSALDGEVPVGEWTELSWDLDQAPAVSPRRPVPAGEPYLAVRFMPTKTGRHTYALRGGGATLAEGFFECRPSKLKAPVRVSPADPFHFERTDGTPWLPIGLNMCWFRGGRTADYEEWLPPLAASGGDFVRLWMCPWCFGLEWDGPPGHYRLGHAWELDQVLREARRLGIGVMLCLDYHGAFREGSNWHENPYNRANGGPCDRPEEFFTGEEAARLYRDRLAYLAARYASHSNLAFWEFFNEVNLVDGFDGPTVAAWHSRMARELRRLDPYDHVITTSCGNPRGDEHLWRVPGIEVAQSHDYAAADWGANAARWTAHHRQSYGKAALFGEFGLNAGAADSAARDPEGIYLHNGIWGAVMAGSSGSAMIWFWDNYVHAQDLYGHYASLARFAEGVNWTQGLRRTEKFAWELQEPGAGPVETSAFFHGVASSWEPGSINRSHTFTVSGEGELDRPELLSRVLHGPRGDGELQNSPTFVADFPEGGEFSVCVSGVSGWSGASLRILVDGEERLSREFPDTDPDSRRTITEYNGPYSVRVGPGRHAIAAVNDGPDWAQVSYLIRNLWERGGPNARVLALAGPEESLVWLQNRDFTFVNVGQFGQEPEPVRPGVLCLEFLAEGAYDVLLWDTWRGRELARTRLSVPASRSVQVPSFREALALRIRRLGHAPGL
jgi:hypothetical protein